MPTKNLNNFKCPKHQQLLDTKPHECEIIKNHKLQDEHLRISISYSEQKIFFTSYYKYV